MSLKNLILFIAILIIVPGAIKAQKGNNQVKIITEAAIPGEDGSNIGYGAFVKGAYGIGSSGQLTLMSGISKFKSKKSGTHIQNSTRIIPVLAGYKYNFKILYAEAQGGYGELGGKVDIGGDWSRHSVGAFIWAVGVGLEYNRLDLGLRYQNAHGAEGKAAGMWNNKTFGFTGFHIGYNFLSRK